MNDEDRAAEEPTGAEAPLADDAALLAEVVIAGPEPIEGLASMEVAPAVPALPAVSEPEAPIRHALESLRESCLAGFDSLRTLFEREIRAESTREKVVDRLHAELQEYKQDFLLQTLRPVLIDLVQLHDDIGKIIDAQDPDVVSSTRLTSLLRDIQQGIEDILYRQGVEPFTVDEASFDPRRQRAIATVATDQAELVKTVAGRHRKGFRAGERVIRPELVSVYAVRRPDTPAPSPQD